MKIYASGKSEFNYQQIIIKTNYSVKEIHIGSRHYFELI